MSEENDKPSLKSRLHIPAWLNIPFIIIIVGAVMILFVQQNNIWQRHAVKGIIFYHGINSHNLKNQLVTYGYLLLKAVVTNYIAC